MTLTLHSKWSLLHDDTFPSPFEALRVGTLWSIFSSAYHFSWPWVLVAWLNWFGGLVKLTIAIFILWYDTYRINYFNCVDLINIKKTLAFVWRGLGYVLTKNFIQICIHVWICTFLHFLPLDSLSLYCFLQKKLFLKLKNGL